MLNPYVLNNPYSESGVRWSFSFFCQVKPTVTCVVMIWYELLLTMHEVTVPDKRLPVKKKRKECNQSVMFTCKHCFSTNTVLTWLMKGWNMVVSDRNIKADEVHFYFDFHLTSSLSIMYKWQQHVRGQVWRYVLKVMVFVKAFCLNWCL